MARGARKSVGGAIITLLAAGTASVLVFALVYFLLSSTEQTPAGGEQTAEAGGAPSPQSLDTETLAAAGRLQVPGQVSGQVSGAGDPPSAGDAAIELTPEQQAALAERAGEKPESPALDVVRVAKDGSAVLAGRAEPGARVEVLVDGVVAQTVEADENGEFVATLDPPQGSGPSEDDTRRLDLSAVTPDGREAASTAPVIVTMSAAPDEPPAALRPAMDGVDILQPTRKAAGAEVTIDAVTYGEKGEITIAGRGNPGETARLYLDNTLQAEAEVAEGGDWRARIEDEVPPALYQLRVDQTAADGKVTGRAETPFERENPANIKLEKGAVVVQPGNNLWRIADYLYGDGARYTVIYRRNKTQIRDPDLIYPGQVFKLPEQTEG